MATLGCTESPYGSGSQRYRIPWPEASGAYSVQTVQVDTFDNPESLHGRWAKIFVSPYIISGEIAAGSAVGRFLRDSNDVLHPLDLATTQATVLYAHMERLRGLTEAAGVADAIRWPAKIGIRARLRETRGDLVNNALYAGDLDAMLMVPYSQDGVPLAYNAGVIAHEHCHAIFYALVQRPLTTVAGRIPGAAAADDWANAAPAEDRPGAFVPRAPASTDLSSRGVSSDDFNDFVLRGINEGVCDFWGWVYSGDASFVGRSLARAAESRRLDREPRAMSAPARWAGVVAESNALPGLTAAQRREHTADRSYALGTEYARFLRSFALEMSGGDASVAARQQAARAVAAALPRFAAAARESFATRGALDPRSAARVFVQSLPTVTPGACRLYERVVGVSSEAERPLACRNGGGSGR